MKHADRMATPNKTCRKDGNPNETQKQDGGSLWNTKKRWRSQMNTQTKMAALNETQRQRRQPLKMATLMKHRDKMAAPNLYEKHRPSSHVIQKQDEHMQ